MVGFPDGSRGKASACNVGDLGLILESEGPLEKEMAIHSSTLAWKIPWMEEPDGLQSMGSQRVKHNWVTSLSVHIRQYMFSRFSRVWLSMTLWTMAARLPCPWDSPSKNTGVGCRFLLQIYISATLLVYSTLFFSCWVHKSVLYVCVSILALQTGSSVPFF